MSLLKKIFSTLTEKPWEASQAAIDSTHAGKTFEISNQMSAVIIIFGVSTTLFSLIFTDLNTKSKKIEFNKNITKPLCVIIGPEGDFSEQERDNILNFKGVKSFKINENILRSETAVISSISILSYILNL